MTSSRSAPPKTNAARILERLGVAFELRTYEVGDEHLDASTVAERVGLSPDQVAKTLVARGDKTGPMFAVLPGSLDLDLRSLAKLSGDRRVELVPLAEVTPLTGYVRGGVTALGAKKDFPVFFEETLALFDRICVSAGQRGLQIVLSPSDYVSATHATSGSIGR